MTGTPNNAIDQVVAEEMAVGSIPAVALAVVREGEQLEATAYGMANLEHMVPATTGAVFKIASITKTFTATAIMMLVEQGKVDLNDRISDYLSFPPETWSAITLRHLLTHTTGIVPYSRIFPPRWGPNDSWEKVVRLVSELPLSFPPGEAWAYENANYVVLGVLIERISGKPYPEFLRQHLLAPLGMTETRLDDEEAILPKRTQGYAWAGETLSTPGQPPLCHKINPSPKLFGYSDGGLVSTVLDLVKWDAALEDERLLRRATLDRMWTPARLNDGQCVEYGLGWIVKDVLGRRNVSHWGRLPGFTAEMSRFIDDRLTVIVLCNRWKVNVARLVTRIAELYLPATASVVG